MLARFPIPVDAIGQVDVQGAGSTTERVLQSKKDIVVTCKDPVTAADLPIYRSDTDTVSVASILSDADGNYSGWVNQPDFDVVFNGSVVFRVRNSPRDGFRDQLAYDFADHRFNDIFRTNLWPADPEFEGATFPHITMSGGSMSAVVEDGWPAVKFIHAPSSGGGITCDIPTVADRYYRILLWGKFPADNAHQMRAIIDSLDGSNVVIPAGNVPIPWQGSGNWEVFEAWVRSAPGAAKLRVQVGFTGGSGVNGTCFIRRARVQEQPVGRLVGDFRHGNFTGFSAIRSADGPNNAAPNSRMSLVTDNPKARFGKYMARFEMQAGDTAGDTTHKTELFTPLRARQGEDIFIRWDPYWPTDFVCEADKFWHYGQVIGAKADLLALDFHNYVATHNGVGEVFQLADGGVVSGIQHIYWQAPFPGRGQIHSVIVHVHIDTDPTVGYLEVWLNGVKQTMTNGLDRYYTDTLNPATGYVGASVGMYREGPGAATQVFYANGVYAAATLEGVLNFPQHPLLASQEDFDALKVATNRRPVNLPLFQSTTPTAWTNMPAIKTEVFGQQRNRVWADLSSFNFARLLVQLGGVAGASGSTLAVEYSTDSGVTWSDFDGSGGPSAPVASASVNRPFVGSWVMIPAAAKTTDVQLRVVGTGGDGAVDPEFAGAIIQLR